MWRVETTNPGSDVIVDGHWIPHGKELLLLDSPDQDRDAFLMNLLQHGVLFYAVDLEEHPAETLNIDLLCLPAKEG